MKLDTPIRSPGPDFATTLPGGELEELYSFVAAGEVLKLVARLFARVRADPGTPVDGPSLTPGGPAPSTLPYRRI